MNVSGHEGLVLVCSAPLCARTSSIFWNVRLHISQGVVVGVGNGLGPGDCVDIDEPGSDDDSGIGAAGAGIGTTGVRE